MDSVPLLANSIFTEIDGSIAHMLNGLCSKPCCQVVEQLALHVDREVLLETRSKVFEAADLRFKQELEARGITGGKPRLELINRKGDLINEKLSKDIVELVKYVCCLIEAFPKELLSTSSKKTYIEIEIPKFDDQSVNQSMPSKDPSSKEPSKEPPGDKDSVILFLLDKTRKLENSLIQLWNYVLNVEKVHGDELSANRKSSKPVFKELMSRPSVQSQHTLEAFTANTPGTQTKSADLAEPTLTQLLAPDAQTQPQSVTGPLAPASLPGSPHAQSATTESSRGSPSSPPTSLPGSGLIPQNQKLPIAADSSVDTPARDTHNSVDNPIVIPDDVRSDKVSEKVITQTSQTTPPIASYSQMVARDGEWQVVGDNKRNSSNLSNKNGSAPAKKSALTGIRVDKGAEFYVQGLERKNGESLKEISEKVRDYCQDRGVRVMMSHVITNRYNPRLVGCRISVPERCIDVVIADRFWPNYITCRKWQKSSEKPGVRFNKEQTVNRGRSRDRNHGHDAGIESRERSRSARRPERSRERSRSPRRRERSKSPQPRERSRSARRRERSRSPQPRKRSRSTRPPHVRMESPADRERDIQQKEANEYWWAYDNSEPSDKLSKDRDYRRSILYHS